MADPGTSPLDALMVVLALVAGYSVGSLPLATWLGRVAGVDVVAQGERNPGSANVWKLAGPGWGALALVADLAKGMLPVAVCMVTVGWWTGWAAGFGALAGAVWPALGRLPGGRGVAAFSGVAVALSPLSGSLGMLVTATVVGLSRGLGRNGRASGIAAGIAVYPVLFLGEQGDLLRCAGLGVLYLVALVRFVTTGRRRA
jgi:acyl phosphate:glycerol-3-phosphate acyltransferase